MLQKVSSVDVSSYQSYTIRRLDQKESSIPDADQYKLTNIKEEALSNKLKYLAVCFSKLFPSGTFGESHPHDIHTSPSDIVKSCLLNKDGRYRKNDQSICYGRRRCVSSKQVCTTSSRVQDSMPCLWGSSLTVSRVPMTRWRAICPPSFRVCEVSSSIVSNVIVNCCAC